MNRESKPDDGGPIDGPRALCDAIDDLTDRCDYDHAPSTDSGELARQHYHMAIALLEQAMCHLNIADTLQRAPFLHLTVEKAKTRA